MMEIISTAQAAVDSAPKGAGMTELAMIFFFVAIFYFILWRPQNKRQKEHRNLMSSLQKGDEVVIAGGLLGKIEKVKDDFLTLMIADGVEIKCQRQSVSTILPKGTIKSV